LRAALSFNSNQLFNSLLIAYNSSAWVKKQARLCVPISGDCSRLGPPKPWARTFPEPRESKLLRDLLSYSIVSTCKNDASQSKVSTNLP
jgi:hypothetical protein